MFHSQEQDTASRDLSSQVIPVPPPPPEVGGSQCGAIKTINQTNRDATQGLSLLEFIKAALGTRRSAPAWPHPQPIRFGPGVPDPSKPLSPLKPTKRLFEGLAAQIKNGVPLRPTVINQHKSSATANERKFVLPVNLKSVAPNKKPRVQESSAIPNVLTLRKKTSSKSADVKEPEKVAEKIDRTFDVTRLAHSDGTPTKRKNPQRSLRTLVFEEPEKSSREDIAVSQEKQNEGTGESTRFVISEKTPEVTQTAEFENKVAPAPRPPVKLRVRFHSTGSLADMISQAAQLGLNSVLQAQPVTGTTPPEEDSFSRLRNQSSSFLTRLNLNHQDDSSENEDDSDWEDNDFTHDDSVMSPPSKTSGSDSVLRYFEYLAKEVDTQTPPIASNEKSDKVTSSPASKSMAEIMRERRRSMHEDEFDTGCDSDDNASEETSFTNPAVNAGGDTNNYSHDDDPEKGGFGNSTVNGGFGEVPDDRKWGSASDFF